MFVTDFHYYQLIMIKSSQQQSNHLKSSKPNEISLSGSFLTTRPKKKLKSSKQKASTLTYNTLDLKTSSGNTELKYLLIKSYGTMGEKGE